MVRETLYERRVAIDAGPARGMVSPEAFGAGIGRALEQGGQMLHQERIEDARITRNLADNAELARFNVAFAEARERFSDAIREARRSDEPGHRDRLAEAWQAEQERLLQGLQSRRVREQAVGSLASWGTGVLSREADWEELRQAELQVDRTDQFLRLSDGRIRRLETSDDYKAEMQIREDYIAGLDVPDKVREQLKRDAEDRGGISFLRGMIERDPVFAKALIASGNFDFLGGDRIEALGNSTDVELRRMEAQAERARNEAIAQIRTNIGVFKQRQSMGLVENDEAFDEPIAAAKLIGDEKLVLELAGLKSDNRFTRIWGPENATALQREQRMAELGGKARRSDDENLELAFLRRNAGNWAAEEAADPVGQHIKRQTGRDAVPAIDVSDGATWGQRASWAEARNFPIFSKAERTTLQALLETPQGEVQVFGELDKLADPFARSRAARELKPTDPLFQMMAMAQPGVRGPMRQGKKVLDNNSKFFVDRLGNRPIALDEADIIINSALKEADEDFRQGVKDGYRAFIAGVLSARGRGDTAAFSDDEMRRQVAAAMRATLGGGKRPDGRTFGGFDQWGERWFVLPEAMDGADFRRAVNQQLLRAGANGPRNPDGSAANLNKAVPVATGDGWYEWETLSGNPIRTNDNKPFRMRIGK